MSALKGLRLVMAFICAFHLIAGFGLMFSIDFQKVAVGLYGAVLPWNDQSIYFLRIIGSFAFVLGTMAFFAARDPLRYSAIVIGFIEFFILRNIHRHFYSHELVAGFGVTELTNNLTTLFFGLQAVLMVVLLLKARKGAA